MFYIRLILNAKKMYHLLSQAYCILAENDVDEVFRFQINDLLLEIEGEPPMQDDPDWVDDGTKAGYFLNEELR